MTNLSEMGLLCEGFLGYRGTVGRRNEENGGTKEPGRTADRGLRVKPLGILI